MGYYHTDERGYVKDKYGNFKDSAEVAKAVIRSIASRELPRMATPFLILEKN